uniref:non-specific serine/threonine protein kinase n=1 Tax=Strongyloides papillosus TaxID=174720 RepID=A0A0N5CCL7_STREA
MSRHEMEKKENVNGKVGRSLEEINNEVYVKVQFLCNTVYPDNVPTIIIIESKGLQERNKDKLLSKLASKGAERKGDSMIADLYAEASDFLYELKKPRTKNLYGKMLVKEAEESNHVHTKVIVGQLINRAGRSLEDVFDHLEQSEYGEILIPRVACQAVCALKWLHEEKLIHGRLGLDCIWLTSNDCIRISDWFITGRLAKFAEEWDHLVKDCKPKVLSRHGSSTETENGSGDCQVYGRSTKADLVMSTRIQEIKNRKNVLQVPSSGTLQQKEVDLNNFIQECDKVKSIDQLCNHNFLNHNLLTMPRSWFPGASKKEIEDLTKFDNDRLTDFFLVSYLDKDGFGEVLLANNTLDGNNYAIKRIPLFLSSKEMQKKIINETRLFSKLYHSNIIRYYNAWVSKCVICKDGNSKSTPADNNDKDKNAVDDNSKSKSEENQDSYADWEPSYTYNDNDYSSSGDSDNEDNDEESVGDSSRITPVSRKLTFPIQTQFNGVSITATPQGLNMTSQSNLNKSHDHDIMSENEHISESSDFEVLFENDEVEEDDSVVNDHLSTLSQSTMGRKSVGSTLCPSDNGGLRGSSEDVDDTSSDNECGKDNEKGERTFEILFIQMEYCEKQTLRNLIDSGNLMTNPEEIWRLFREMLAGLDYIHKKAMIHRDIKPLNIFIDAHNNVKIGDFGLATIDVNGRRNQVQVNLSDHNGSATNPDEVLSQGGGDLTQDVGTALYIAPELHADSGHSGKPYTSKIDVYSLGVVLFEMFYRPLPLGMERLVILPKLRNSLEFPKDFGCEITTNQAKKGKDVINWMLQKDQNKRPSISDLIKSERVPLVGVEENEFQVAVKEILRNRKSTLNKWMYDTIFSVDSSFAMRHIFDKKTCLSLKDVNGQRVLEFIKKQMSEFFYLHGFTPYDCHTLLPEYSDGKNKTSRTRSYKVLDRSGLLLNLNSDLRRNFVRVCARNGIDNVKRFCYGKIFTHVDDLPGTHPVERINCAIDIVGSQEASNELSGELLFMMANIPKQVVVLKTMKTILRVGDIRLFHAICKHIGITNDQLINSVKSTLAQFAMQTKEISHDEKIRRLLGAGLTKTVASSLLKFMESYLSLDLLRNGLIKQLQNSRYPEVQEVAKNVINDFVKIMECYELLSASSKRQQSTIIFDPSTIIKSDLYSTSISAIVSIYVPKFDGHESYKPCHLITGGRYDKYLESKRQVDDKKPLQPVCAMGCSIDLSVISYIIVNNLYKTGFCIPSFSTLVGYTDTKSLKGEAYKLIGELWKNGISSDVYHQPISNTEDAIEICKERGIKNLLLVVDKDSILVTENEGLQYGKNSPEYHSIHQQKFSIEDAVDYIVTCEEYSFEQINNGVFQNVVGTPSSNGPRRQRIRSRNNSNQNDRESIAINDAGRNTTTITTPSHVTATFTNNADIIYALPEKPSHILKRKIESFVRNNFNEIITTFSSKQRIIIIVSDVNTDLLRNIVANIDVHCNADYFDSVYAEILINCKVGKSKLKPSADVLGMELKKYLYTTSFQKVIVLCSTQDEKFYKILC